MWFGVHKESLKSQVLSQWEGLTQESIGTNMPFCKYISLMLFPPSPLLCFVVCSVKSFSLLFRHASYTQWFAHAVAK